MNHGSFISKAQKHYYPYSLRATVMQIIFSLLWPFFINTPKKKSFLKVLSRVNTREISHCNKDKEKEKVLTYCVIENLQRHSWALMCRSNIKKPAL